MSVEMVRLGDVAEFINGFAFKPENWTANGLPIVRIQNLNDNSKPFNYSNLNVADKFIVNPGEILVSWSASLGVFYWTGPTNALVNQHIFRVRPKPIIYTGYLFYAIQEKLSEMEKYTHGSTMKHINRAEFLNLLIPLPSLERQREIAAVLDKVDELRAKRRQSISKLEELLQSTFLEMFGDPVENPKEWEVRKLGEVADVVSGVTKGKKYKDATLVELPYMRVANVQDGRIDLSEIKTVEVSYAEAERYRLMPGDVLLTEGGDPDKLGRGAVWHGEIDECIHQNHIFRVRGQSDLLRPEYLSSLIGSSYGKGYFLRMAKQTTGIASINMTQLKGFPVLLPPIESQDRLTAAYNKRNAVMEGYKLHLQHLDTLYSSLQAQFFGVGA